MTSLRLESRSGDLLSCSIAGEVMPSVASHPGWNLNGPHETTIEDARPTDKEDGFGKPVFYFGISALISLLFYRDL